VAVGSIGRTFPTKGKAMIVNSSGMPPAGPLVGRDDSQHRVLAYLRRHHALSLATCGADGPWAATVFYVNRGFDLYFRSKTSARHVRNLTVDSRVAATVSQDPEDWRAIQGLQLEGRVEVVTNADEQMQAMKGFSQRYPFVEVLWGDEGRGGGATDAGSRKVYRVTSDRIVFRDHEKSAEPYELHRPALQSR
jgi:uncharacterized protein YhbP (UPF0306 family)